MGRKGAGGFGRARVNLCSLENHASPSLGQPMRIGHFGDLIRSAVVISKLSQLFRKILKNEENALKSKEEKQM